MRRARLLILAVFACAFAARSPAAFADDAATVMCKDGSTSKGGKGACSHHGGVGAGSATTPSAAPAGKPPAEPAGEAPMVKCKDGSTSKGGKGACSHHGGVGNVGSPANESSAAPAAPPKAESRTGTATPPPSTQGRAAPQSRPSSGGAPAAPGQATAKCKDGSMSYSAHHSGACSHHGGVTQWLQAQ